MPPIAKVVKNAEGETGKKENVTEAEEFGQDGMREVLEAQAEIFSDDERIDVFEERIHEMRLEPGDGGFHVEINDIHRGDIKKEAGAPSPGGWISDATSDQDGVDGDESEIKKGFAAGQTERADETGRREHEKGSEENLVGEEAGGRRGFHSGGRFCRRIWRKLRRVGCSSGWRRLLCRATTSFFTR